MYEKKIIKTREVLFYPSITTIFSSASKGKGMAKSSKQFICDIRDLNENGQGVSAHEGKVVFVNNAIPGDKVMVEIIKESKTYDVARVLSYLQKNHLRIPPFCPIYKPCGGCNCQDIRYPSLLEIKRQNVVNCLKRIGNIENADIVTLPCVGTDCDISASFSVKTFEDIYLRNRKKLNEEVRNYNKFNQIDSNDEAIREALFYRNKVIYAAENVNDKLALGFYSARTHKVVSTNVCAIQAVVFDLLRRVVCSFCDNNNLIAYNEQSGLGQIRKVLVRKSSAESSLMLCISSYENIDHSLLLKLARQIDKELLLAGFKEKLSSFFLNINRSKGNKVMGDEYNLIRGKDHLVDELLGLKFKISPQAFFQVNSRQTEILYQIALSALGDLSSSNVLDLYCGTGTISLIMAKKAQSVTGIEIVPEAISDAKFNAKINKLSNTYFISGKAESVVPELLSSSFFSDIPSKDKIYDIVVLDPPRKGLETSLIETIASVKPKKILYVSCHPGSLARDLRLFNKHNYSVSKVVPVDMFPWTTHVETVVLMSRRE